jgi:PAS domain S-box-containing protein
MPISPISPMSAIDQCTDVPLVQQAFECSPNSMFIIDPEEMKFVNANQMALSSLGYSKEELLSKTPGDVDTAFSNETMKAAFESIINSKEQHATFPTVHQRKDGSTFEVESYLRCFNENSHTYILVSVTDTSVLKTAQDKLRFHATLFNSISDAIIATDEKFCIISYNTYAQEMFGWDINEAVGKPTKELLSPVYTNALREVVHNNLFENGSWQGEVNLYKKNGEAFPAFVSIGVIKDNQGKITGAVAVIRDITGMKQLEKSLKDLNEQLEQRIAKKTEELINVFDRISDAFNAFDADWNYTYVNRKAAEIVGRSPKNLISKNIWKEFPEAVGGSIYELYHRAMREQKVMRDQQYYAPLDRWFEGTVYPSPNGISVFFQDITEKKKAERALAESELLYRTIVETVQEGIWQIDENNNTTFVNNFMAKLLGCTKEELMGSSLFQFMTEEAKQGALELVDERKMGMATQHEFTFIKNDGSPVYTLLQTVPLFKEGRYAGALATVLDISERKNAEEKNRFKADLLNTIGQAAIATDMQGIVTYWNKAAEDIYGWTEKEAIGNNIVDLTPACQSREQAVQIMESLIQGQSWSGEFTVQRKDGTVFPALVTDAPIYDEQGKLSGIIGISSDVTERNRIQEALLLSERNYRLLFEENPVPLWMTDATTFSFIDINPATVAQYGYTKEEFICMNSEDIKVPEERYQLQKLKEKENKQKLFEEVVRHIKKNGDIIYVRITANLIVYNKRKVWLVAGRDITQELLYEQSLRQQQQQLSLIFNNTENAMWLMKVEANNRLRLQIVNNALADLCKMDKEDMADRFVDEIFDISLYKKITSKYVRCIENGTVQRFTNIAQINDVERIFDITVIPIQGKEGLVVQLLGVCADITERKKAERLLIQSEEKYKALFEKSPLPKWIYDSETLRFLEVNHTATVQYGYTKEEFLCMTLFDIKPKERAKDLIPVQNNGWPESIDIDTIHKKKNGELIKVHVTANALRYENRPARMAIVVDRTEQEKAKDELIATTQQLRELASHLQDIREEERTYIAREIHDELGQQLTALKMDISLLNKKWDIENESVKKKLKGALELIDTTINSVRKIAAHLRPSMLDDLGLAEAIAWQSHEFNSRTGIHVDCSVDVRAEKFSPAISIAVFRIFQESLTNIARHAGATKVICTLQQKDKLLSLTITDNGKGFDINEQSKRSTLGLLGMKERAIMLNGTYSIETNPGNGTKVSVEIPLEENHK